MKYKVKHEVIEKDDKIAYFIFTSCMNIVMQLVIGGFAFLMAFLTKTADMPLWVAYLIAAVVLLIGNITLAKEGFFDLLDRDDFRTKKAFL